MTFSIRSARIDDLPEMFHISVSAHQAGYTAFISQANRELFDERYTLSFENEQKYVQSMTERLHDPKWSSWLVEDKGKVLGYVVMEQVSERLHRMRGLFVHPDYQGQGVGSSLMQTALDSVDEGVVELSVIAANDRAKHIYEKSGFVVTSVNPKLYFGAKQDIMTLTKRPQ